jgi:hypothetical protein
VQLERLGVATVLICTEPFLPLARAVARQEGLETLAVVTLPHPVGGKRPEHLDDVLAAVTDRVADALLTPPGGTTRVPDNAAFSPHSPAGLDERSSAGGFPFGAGRAVVHAAPGDVGEFLAFAEEHRWSDGLPLVPPTARLVEQTVRASGRDGDEVLGAVPPSNRGATVRAVAANAVMAGCPPQLMPVVVAAVRAVLEPRFNLQAVTTTTHPATPLVVVHGPVVDELGFNAGAGTFGQGNRANATTGRALRLVLQNIGEARPGETDRATHGSPTKYSYCLAENAAASPFPTFHDERGGGPRGAVTVIGGEAPHNVNDHGSTDATGILRNVAGTMATLGCNNVYLRGQMLVVLSPEHAEVVARDGYDRARIAGELAALARINVHGVSAGNLKRFRAASPHVFDHLPDDGYVPMLDQPDDLLLFVAGGPGKHSVVVPTFGTTNAVTVDLDPPGVIT